MTALLRDTRAVSLTREQWLTAATHALASHFFPITTTAKKEEVEHHLPQRMSCMCGFPWNHKEAIGQCFSPELSADGTTHIFVCPTQDDPVRVLDILLHELGHAALGTSEGHGPRFKKFVAAVGLSGKATATIAEPGTHLYDTLQGIARSLGPYPHRALSKVTGKKKKKKERKGGWVRLQSVTEETYRIVISPKMLEEHGAPTDPWGDEMEVVS